MKTAVLFSGGKDSVAALYRAKMAGEEISCLITLTSQNSDSYMFHTPNITLTALQAKSAGIPIIEQITEGNPEGELVDLEDAILIAVERYGIEGLVTGAIRSVYQATRIEKICNRHGLWCFSPLWLIDEEKYLLDLIDKGFEIIIVGVAADPFNEEWLGKKINAALLERLKKLKQKYGISVAGEGGEYESFVIYAPFFSSKIDIIETQTSFHLDRGRYQILKAGLQ